MSNDTASAALAFRISAGLGALDIAAAAEEALIHAVLYNEGISGLGLCLVKYLGFIKAVLYRAAA